MLFRSEKNILEEVHSQRVCEMCHKVCSAYSLSKSEQEHFKMACLLHEVGKIAIDESILNKPNKLSEKEWLEMKRHSEIGYRILSSVNEYSKIAETVLAHHERWDGKGYPKGLQGEEIPRLARIVTIVDAFDAMTSDRPYRKALGEEAAIMEIVKNAGTQFDPQAAKIFIEKVLGRQWKHIMDNLNRNA